MPSRATLPVLLALLLAGPAPAAEPAPEALPAANVTWTTSTGILDTEVSTKGGQVFGYYWNSSGGAPTVTVNSVPLTLRTTSSAPPCLEYNGSYNNVESPDLYRVPLSAGKEIRWTPAGATLQQSGDLVTWSSMPNAVSPYRTAVGPSGKFYRAKPQKRAGEASGFDMPALKAPTHAHYIGHPWRLQQSPPSHCLAFTRMLLSKASISARTSTTGRGDVTER